MNKKDCIPMSWECRKSYSADNSKILYLTIEDLRADPRREKRLLGNTGQEDHDTFFLIK